VFTPDFVQQRHFGVGQMFASRHYFKPHLVIGAVADALLPSPVGFSQQPPGVDEIKHLARHRAIPHGEIIAATNGRIAPVKGKPIQKVHEFHQLHDIHLAATTLQKEARGFGGLAEIKAKIHNNSPNLSRNQVLFNKTNRFVNGAVTVETRK
jgi:hypothetical protein